MLRSVLRTTAINNATTSMCRSHVMPRHASTDLVGSLPPGKTYNIAGNIRVYNMALKVGLVAGGTSGVGLAAAHSLLEWGVRGVVITGTDDALGDAAVFDLEARHGRKRARFVKCSVTSVNQFEEAFEMAKGKYGGLDIVVNADRMCNSLQWEKEVVTNVIGTMRGIRLAQHYLKGHQGVVVNIAGVSALSPNPSSPSLAACHHAIVGMSRSVPARAGLRVLCLCHGPTEGDCAHKEGGAQKSQSSRSLGLAVAHLITYAPHNSVWYLNGSDLAVLRIPKEDDYAKHVTQCV